MGVSHASPVRLWQPAAVQGGGVCGEGMVSLPADPWGVSIPLFLGHVIRDPALPPRPGQRGLWGGPQLPSLLAVNRPQCLSVG